MSGRDAGVVMSTPHGDGLRLALSGHLDAGACDRLSALLADVRGPGAEVRADLSHAGPLPVAVLRCLVTTAHRLAEVGGRLVVEHPSAAAARGLRTSGLHRVLQVEGWPQPPAVADVLDDEDGAAQA